MKNSKIIPECWDEMTTKQFKYLLRKIFVMMRNPEISKDDVLRDFADYILGRNNSLVGFFDYLRGHDNRLRSVKHVDYMLLVNSAAEILSWIFEVENDEVYLNFDTTKNLIPRIGKLIGPQLAGYDLRFSEYRKACWMYNRYTIEHDMASLDGLVGILYRPQAPKGDVNTFNGDYREPFNEYLISNYAKRVKRVPEHIKWGVYLWFGNFCKYLMSGEFCIDGAEISFAPLFQSGGDPDGKRDESLGMTSVLFTLAESRTFGNVDETDNAFLFKVMLKLLNDDITAKNLKKA